MNERWYFVKYDVKTAATFMTLYGDNAVYCKGVEEAVAATREELVALVVSDADVTIVEVRQADFSESLRLGLMASRARGT